MNRRDPNSRQPGGYRSDDSAWDSPQQATQWQDDSSEQTGSGSGAGWTVGYRSDTDQGRQARETRAYGAGSGHSDRFQTGYASDRYSSNRYQSGRGNRSSYGFEQRNRDDDRGWDRDRETSFGRQDDWDDTGRGGGRRYGAHDEGAYRGGYRNEYRDDYRQDYRAGRDYRSGRRDAEYPLRNYDASGGNDYSSFTSEDYGGRDFSRSRGGLSGGGASSESYRPSWGPGSWGSQSSGRSSGKDYGDWREYGESRGFLERAGDEIASWFGDEEAARRREQDHRGRGPSDYTRSDERIREDVNDALTNDWRLDASSIRVTVKDGEVTLEGSVSARNDKRRAEHIADDVTGVRHVQNNLRFRRDTDSVTAGTSTPGLSHAGTTGSTGSGTTSSTGTSSGSTVTGSTTAGTTASATSTDKSSGSSV